MNADITLISKGKLFHDFLVDEPSVRVAYGNASYDSRYMITYKFFLYSKLQHPYSSNCHFYQGIGYKYRKDGLAACKSNVTSWFHHSLYHSELVDLELNSSMKFILRLYTMVGGKPTPREIKMRALMRRCELLYASPDCESTKYFPTLLSSVIYAKTPWEGNKWKITVFQPQEPQFSVHEAQKLSNIDILIHVGSILAFWFGTTMYGMASTIIDFLLTCHLRGPMFINCPVPKPKKVTSVVVLRK